MKNIIIISTIFLIFGIKSFSQSKFTYLVLGTKSTHLNDVQDRLLREKIIYKIFKTNQKIVPVMEIENLIQENKINIRNCSSENIKRLAYKFNADFTLTGSIKLKKDKLYYILIIYNKKNNKFYTTKIIIEENKIFQKYCDKLSDKIVIKSLDLVKTEKEGKNAEIYK